MRTLIIAVVMVVGLIFALISGAFSASGGLMIMGFCGLPFAMFALGWAAKGAMAGKRIMIVSPERAAQPSLNYTSESDIIDRPRSRPRPRPTIDTQV